MCTDGTNGDARRFYGQFRNAIRFQPDVMQAELEEYRRATNVEDQLERHANNAEEQEESDTNVQEPVFEKYGLDTPGFTMHAVLVTQGRVKFVRDNGSLPRFHT